MNVALVGYGKMGREIEKLLVGRGHSISLIIDENNSHELTAGNLKARGVDVAIEFSAPHSAVDNILRCFEASVPVVSGTTGWLDRLPEVTAKCGQCGTAFFYASNYSIGVNVTFMLNRVLARAMNRFTDYDVTVEEVHHTQKKDSPSGTAITLAGDIVGSLDRKQCWVDHVTTTATELEVASVRRSVVPGIHTVTYESPVDVITLSHSAKSREGFAIGAVAAAEFIAGKKGLFSMDDLLGL